MDSFSAEDSTIRFDTHLRSSCTTGRWILHRVVANRKESNIERVGVKNCKVATTLIYVLTGICFTHFDYNTGAMDRQRTWGPTAGITLGFTLFDGFNRRREQRNARISLENSELEIERYKLALESDFANMWMAYQNNIELAKLEIESLENAELNYEIAMERYKIGDLSGLELREAQNSLLEAEQRLLTAQYNTKLYEISLAQISGLVDRYLH